ncbi:hypothetical protein QYS49_32480 [Marivirga salinae]|uniref:JAB domain-containing protein n=1 Tax=Marivirga salinarum TaxID=3059078 RepID=A0AA51NBJ1_9BACT|nr:hypothetical protein [Marivirga sp. BDSF4-3]WMN12113.1 hypothetical protein QYS49_32480 [Marivirga sp. BDSF4-3]
MTDLESITKINIPMDIMEDAYLFMRKIGRDGLESVVLFLGKLEGKVFNVSKLYIPEQESYCTSEGLLYYVSHEELDRLGDFAYDNKLTLYIQMHTHPGKAYHSLADDENCIVTRYGGLSIVVPNFARDNIDTKFWAVYQLDRFKGWKELSSELVQSTFIME